MTASSSSTAAWAPRSSSSTSPWKRTTACRAGAMRRWCSTGPTSSRACTRRWSRRARRSSRPTRSRLSRLKLDEWGLAEHTHEINVKAAQIARKAVGEDRFVAGSIGPTGFLPASEDPIARPDPLPRARRGLRRAVQGPARGRRGPPDRRDRAGHPRGQGRDLRHARGVQARRPQRADPGLRLAAAQRRQDAAGHGHLRRARDARGAEGRRDRPQLLHRPRGHARRDPLPRRVLAGARALHPERRHPAPGAGRRDRLPRAARPAGRGAGRLRGALRRRPRRRLLRHHARAHRRDQGALRRSQHQRSAPRRGPRTSAA